MGVAIGCGPGVLEILRLIVAIYKEGRKDLDIYGGVT